MSASFKPMLASPMELQHVRWPMYASVKLDGIRAVVRDKKLLSRSLKLIPNTEISAALSKAAFEGLDGELIVGPTTSPMCYRDTVSGVMSEDKSSNWTFHVFDLYQHSRTFQQRLDALMERHTSNAGRVKLLPQTLVYNEEQLDQFEVAALGLGHEGVILRHPDSPYKFGRSTAREGYLLKVKRFTDSEAEIIGFEEEMFNGNAAETNELGRTKRSTAAVGLSGKGTLGAFKVRDCVSGVEFAIGTGLTALQRGLFWQRQDEYLGKLVKYKHFLIGVKTAPRHPVFLGFRDARDL